MRKTLDDEIIEQEVRRDKYQQMKNPRLMQDWPQRAPIEEEKKGHMQFNINQSA